MTDPAVGRASEGAHRVSASATEIVAAVVRGALPALLLTRRVALPAAHAALRELEQFVGPQDTRLLPLRELAQKLSATPLRTKIARKSGENVVYKTQRPHSKRSAHVVVPINVLERDGNLDQVKVSFEDDKIVITRV